MHKFISFLLIITTFLCSSTIFGQSIEHKEIKFKSSQLSKKLDDSYTQIYETEVLEIPFRNPEPFLAFGFKALFATGSPKAVFETRYLPESSEWSAWKAVKEDDTEKMQTEVFFAELTFLKKNIKFVQLRVKTPDDELKELNLFFISPGKTTVDNLNLIKASAAVETQSIEMPSFVSRKSWGCPQPEHIASRLLTNVTHVVIHHSAANNFSKDFAAIVRSYWSYHVNVYKWDDIGYNWLVDENGTLYKGRAWQNAKQENVQGAHNTGKNRNTVGICFIGDYEKYLPSTKGLNKLTAIMAFLCNKYGIDPTSQSYHAAINKINDNIAGHQQSGGGTRCPGTHLIGRLNELRQNTRNRMIDAISSY